MHKLFFSIDLSFDICFYENSTVKGSIKNTQTGLSVKFTGISISNQFRTELAFFEDSEGQNSISFVGWIENELPDQKVLLNWLQVSENGQNAYKGSFTFLSNLEKSVSIINFDEHFTLFQISDEVETSPSNFTFQMGNN